MLQQWPLLLLLSLPHGSGQVSSRESFSRAALTGDEGSKAAHWLEPDWPMWKSSTGCLNRSGWGSTPRIAMGAAAGGSSQLAGYIWPADRILPIPGLEPSTPGSKHSVYQASTFTPSSQDCLRQNSTSCRKRDPQIFNSCPGREESVEQQEIQALQRAGSRKQNYFMNILLYSRALYL